MSLLSSDLSPDPMKQRLAETTYRREKLRRLTIDFPNAEYFAIATAAEAAGMRVTPFIRKILRDAIAEMTTES